MSLLGAAATINKPTEAINARITEGLDTDYKLYKIINKRPGYSIYELAKEMGWSSGKVYGSVRDWKRKDLFILKRISGAEERY